VRKTSSKVLANLLLYLYQQNYKREQIMKTIKNFAFHKKFKIRINFIKFLPIFLQDKDFYNKEIKNIIEIIVMKDKILDVRIALAKVLKKIINNEQEVLGKDEDINKFCFILNQNNKVINKLFEGINIKDIKDKIEDNIENKNYFVEDNNYFSEEFKIEFEKKDNNTNEQNKELNENEKEDNKEIKNENKEEEINKNNINEIVNEEKQDNEENKDNTKNKEVKEGKGEEEIKLKEEIEINKENEKEEIKIKEEIEINKENEKEENKKETEENIKDEKEDGGKEEEKKANEEIKENNTEENKENEIKEE